MYCDESTLLTVLTSGQLLEKLRQVPLFKDLADEPLRRICEQGDSLWVEAGEQLLSEGELANYFYVLLEGEVRVTKRVGPDDMRIATYDPGTFFAEVPILTGTPYLGSVQVLQRSLLFRLSAADFWQLLSHCPMITSRILRTTAERVQNLQALLQQREKLSALGKIAAGLAHELNNPAAAAARASSQLIEAFQQIQLLSRGMRAQLSSTEMEFLTEVQAPFYERHTRMLLDPLVRSDREEEMSVWLEAHQMQDGWRIASTLVNAGISIDWLGTLSEHMSLESLVVTLTWMNAIMTSIELTAEIAQSTGRISDLIQAVKGYSYMDQAPINEIDIHVGIENTLKMFGHKLKATVSVIREYDLTLPVVPAYGGELNQVWTNLIDNALDAINGHGTICIRTTQEHQSVLVEITDSGPGIAPDVLPHLFEPFFTTKEVGQGTGLGLDISYRIVVNRHNGDLSVVSRPGETRFQVRLPIQAT